MKMFVIDEVYDETRQFETEAINRAYRQGTKLYVEYKDGSKDFLIDEDIDAQRTLRNLGDTMKMLKGKVQPNADEFKGLCEDIGAELEMMKKDAGFERDSKREQRELYLRNDNGRQENLIGCGNPV